MQLQTTRFDQIVIDPDLIFTFPSGLPGFANEQRFVLLNIGLDETPFIWMQSVDNPDLCFLLVDPKAAFNNYTIAIGEPEAEQLECAPTAELQMLCTVSVPNGDLQQATVNLKAPLLFNSQSKLALQTIIDQDTYSTRHPLFTEGGE